jgi:hypothetical protein
MINLLVLATLPLRLVNDHASLLSGLFLQFSAILRILPVGGDEGEDDIEDGTPKGKSNGLFTYWRGAMGGCVCSVVEGFMCYVFVAVQILCMNMCMFRIASHSEQQILFR